VEPPGKDSAAGGTPAPLPPPGKDSTAGGTPAPLPPPGKELLSLPAHTGVATGTSTPRPLRSSPRRRHWLLHASPPPELTSAPSWLLHLCSSLVPPMCISSIRRPQQLHPSADLQSRADSLGGDTRSHSAADVGDTRSGRRLLWVGEQPHSIWPSLQRLLILIGPPSLL
jgi:hypothetical protein